MFINISFLPRAVFLSKLFCLIDSLLDESGFLDYWIMNAQNYVNLSGRASLIYTQGRSFLCIFSDDTLCKSECDV